MFDWTILNLQRERSRMPSDRQVAPPGGEQRTTEQQPPQQDHSRSRDENGNLWRQPGAPEGGLADRSRQGEQYNTATGAAQISGARDLSQRSGSRGHGGGTAGARGGPHTQHQQQQAPGLGDHRSQQNQSVHDSQQGTEKPVGHRTRSLGQ